MTFTHTLYLDSVQDDVTLLVDRLNEPDPETNYPAEYSILRATTKDGRNVPDIPWQECTDDDLDKAWAEAVQSEIDDAADREIGNRRDG